MTFRSTSPVWKRGNQLPEELQLLSVLLQGRALRGRGGCSSDEWRKRRRKRFYGMAGMGVRLDVLAGLYTDESYDSYPNIFDNAGI